MNKKTEKNKICKILNDNKYDLLFIGNFISIIRK